MKKQDIRNMYTQKVTELLNEGYTIFPDTMNGSQGEIAHIDLTNGSEILRVLLHRDRRYDRDEGGYWGDTVVLTVGKAGEDTRVGSNWDDTIWNNRLEVRSRIEFADIGSDWRSRRGAEWYTTLEEGARITSLRHARYRAKGDTENGYDRRETLGDTFKLPALRWLRRQPRMKTCRMDDIEKIERVTRPDGHRHFEIRARHQTFTLGR